jgi:hypothetical protein
MTSKLKLFVTVGSEMKQIKIAVIDRVKNNFFCRFINEKNYIGFPRY